MSTINYVIFNVIYIYIRNFLWSDITFTSKMSKHKSMKEEIEIYIKEFK